MIKVATAGLTYVMFVALSRSMGVQDYGLFAFGFSLATMLAIGAGMGQQTAVLRFWPEETVANNPDRAVNAVRSGWALVVLAGAGLSFALAATAGIMGWVRQDFASYAHLFGAALLILPMAGAEYGSSVLRAQGSVWSALVPRDILWRILVPALIWLLYLQGAQVSGATALTLSAVLLMFTLVIQFLVAWRRGYVNGVSFSGLKSYLKERGGASKWFVIGTVVDSAALNVDIVLVGLFVASESAGLYFNAFRTAALMTLFMFAITLVVAPMVSRHFHSGEMAKAQAVTALCTWAGFLFSVGIFVGFWLFGDLILSLFGESYAEGKIILLILSVGLLADAATGPTRIVMMMTGHERAYVRIFGSIMALGMVVRIVVIPIYGLVGAAFVNAGSRIVAQSVISWWTYKNVGIDTSLFSAGALFRVFKKSD
ncbi:MAG: oligosaccharide flippase family protein [Devosiaceae bacterium]|nr:oligosaccharide flippase family protein [Devosiaceae bacterium]